MWIGVHYEYPFGGMMADRPEWIPKGARDWRRDLKAIRDTGFNLVRVRVGLDSELQDIAALLDLCREVDLKVVLGSALFYVSDAFVRQYPDSATVWPDGSRTPSDPTDYGWPRACLHHPVFRERRNAFWEGCVRRFARHPAIVGWDVHNEPSLAGCFCANTLAAYRQVVVGELGSVAAYNRAFGTAFGSIGELVPPRQRDANPPAHRHWRLFMVDELNRFLNEARDLVRLHAPDQPVTYNPTDPFAPMHTGQDWWNLRGYDTMSCSLYWGSGEQTPGRAAPLELLKALGPGKDVFISEFQGGGFTFSEHLLYTGKHMVTELNAAFSHGLQGVIFYRWDPLLCGPEPWINGLTAVDTHHTEKRLTLKQGIAALRRHEPLIDASKSLRPSVGLYLTRQQVLHASELGYDLRMRVGGTYSMLSSLGYEVGFLLDEFDPATCPYEVMFFPYMFIDAPMVAKMAAYAASGRRAVLELPVQDLEAAQRVGALWELKVAARDEPRYWFVGWDLRGTGQRPGAARGKYLGFAEGERLLFDPGRGRVLATYGLDGRPAIVLPELGDGNVLVTGFPLGRTHARMLHHDLRRLIGRFVGQRVKPDIAVRGVCEEYRPMVEVRARETDLEGLLFVINRGLYDYELEVAVKGFEPVRVKSRMCSAVTRRLRRPEPRPVAARRRRAGQGA